MVKSGPPLAKVLTRRLTLIAIVVFLVNSMIVGVYYASNSRAIDSEVIANQMRLLEEGLNGQMVPADAEVRALFNEHPESYGFALIDRGGNVLDAMNSELIPPGAIDLYADEWMTRSQHLESEALVGGIEFYQRNDGLRAVFVMKDDPAKLKWRAYVSEFYAHVWLPILPLIFLLIGTNLFWVRSELKPISKAAAWARELQPGSSEPPPELAFPAEIADLVQASQRTIKRLEDALSVESRRAAEIAHALRTPVAVLLARMDALPESELANKLRADTLALSRTVQQVLASARVEVLAEKSMEQVNLCEIAQSVVAALAPVAYENHLDVSLVAPAKPVFARAIAEGVEVALYNLVENAIFHSRKGPIEIKVGPGCRISIRDYGEGLPANFEQQLFKPFWRGSNAAQGGTGLGLSIVKRIQQAQGGSVSARNMHDGGAEFTLSFQS
ncbi:sensor histidine kinase [Aliidiomarina iranensis]|uniref:histidine kinase n=1 Tax=Aliidiomarina iranensis TaxID=1434071 RepID=A0A432W0U7_9GAMM|nr:HAMP domain-containing sensor histidine kinase [Aliidiomarina iranensis]RUO22646.1 sensor histidine kinase [Aliidiomarina iranensis]